jgi:hypothetical protein
MEKLRFDQKRMRIKHCPCGKSNRDGKFVPFEGFDDKGFCHSCGDTFFPKIENDPHKRVREIPCLPPKPASFIDPQHLSASLKGYEHNNFVLFLESRFGKTIAMEAVKTYKIGTSKKWLGANIFWQIDVQDRIRSGKIMLYDSSTGKRQNKNSWVHSVLKLEDYNLNQCLFGSHLLKSDSVKHVAIVESEKTAIIGNIIKPEYIWLATGGKSNLRPDRFRSLKNRNVFLFPDLTKPGERTNCYELWTEKTEELSREIPDALFHVSDYLETNATAEEHNMGLDIADYFLKWDWSNEKSEGNEPIQKQIISENAYSNEISVKNKGLKKQFNSKENEDEQIRAIERAINRTQEEIEREEANIQLLKDEIRNCEIPSETIQANKELLREYRQEYGY